MDKLNGKIVNRQSMSAKITNRQSISGNTGMPSRGASDYNLLANKPSIDDVPLIGNKTLNEFGDREITNLEIQEIIDSVFN